MFRYCRTDIARRAQVSSPQEAHTRTPTTQPAHPQSIYQTKSGSELNKVHKQLKIKE
ncbi:hypothetical protein J2Y64_002052 [Aeromonas salmonicida]|nr:hypothetical protein [Aeromonas salmonicida]